MKPKNQFLTLGQWALFSAISLGSATHLLATPQMEPSGAAETAEFIQVDFQGDSQLKGATPQIRIDGGVAIITGKAKSISQVERATARAIACSEVRVVVNQMEIEPAPTGKFADRVKLAFKNQKMVRNDDITVTTNGSRVSLSGEVGTADEQDLARKIVSQVAGVTGIDNNLVVNFEGVRTDAQIAAQLKFMISNDPLCTGLDLVVKVKDGTVTLNGDVGSKGEVERLLRRSYVTGIMEVDVSQVSIDRNLAMEGLGDKNYSSDESLEAMKMALEHDSRINAGTIQLAMDESGTMTLNGTVERVAQRDAVESTARNVPGVLKVSNQLRIHDDSLIASNSSR